MKVHFTAIAAATLIGAFGTQAMAAAAITAKLQAPIEGRKKPVAGGAVFVCEADTCVASNPSGDTLSTSGCRDLARSVGAVASYGSDAKQLAAEKLTACNAVAKKK